jgi:hypothetical protein
MAKHINTPYVIQIPTRDPSDIIAISSFTDSSFADCSDLRVRATKGTIHFVQHAPVMRGSHKINRMSPNSNAAEQATTSVARKVRENRYRGQIPIHRARVALGVESENRNSAYVRGFE